LKSAHQITMTAAEEAKNKIFAGAAAETVLADNQVVDGPYTVKRTAPGTVDPMVVGAAFQMPYPENNKPSFQVVNLVSGEIALVLLDKVTTPVEIANDQIKAVRQQLENDVANSDFEFALATLKDAAEIQRNTGLLQ